MHFQGDALSFAGFLRPPHCLAQARGVLWVHHHLCLAPSSGARVNMHPAAAPAPAAAAHCTSTSFDLSIDAKWACAPVGICRFCFPGSLGLAYLVGVEDRSGGSQRSLGGGDRDIINDRLFQGLLC